MIGRVSMAAILGALCSACEAVTTVHSKNYECEIDEAELRLDQMQWIGTHNSYHVAPDSELMELFSANRFTLEGEWNAERLKTALDYTYPPLDQQLQNGIRHFELDLFDDPIGGKYAQPGFLRYLTQHGETKLSPFDPDKRLEKPGIKVLHHPDLDARTTCYLLSDCLSQINQWRDKNPTHLPIIINLEIKEIGGATLSAEIEPVAPVSFDHQAWHRLHTEILEHFETDEILTPQLVQREYKDIKSAIRDIGWPTLETARGKVIFLLLDRMQQNLQYINFLDETGEAALLHVAAGDDHPRSSYWLGDQEATSWTEKGVGHKYLVYVRADAHGDEARGYDTSRRDRAFSSGAQIIATDFPDPRRDWSEYSVSFEGKYVRANYDECVRVLSD